MNKKNLFTIIALASICMFLPHRAQAQYMSENKLKLVIVVAAAQIVLEPILKPVYYVGGCVKSCKDMLCSAFTSADKSSTDEKQDRTSGMSTVAGLCLAAGAGAAGYLTGAYMAGTSKAPVMMGLV